MRVGVLIDHWDPARGGAERALAGVESGRIGLVRHLHVDAADVEPSRLARAKLKLLGLLERRTAGQTGLVVFSGHAFASVGGGIAITYAFLVLMPKIAAAQPVLEDATHSGL